MWLSISDTDKSLLHPLLADGAYYCFPRMPVDGYINKQASLQISSVSTVPAWLPVLYSQVFVCKLRCICRRNDVEQAGKELWTPPFLLSISVLTKLTMYFGNKPCLCVVSQCLCVFEILTCNRNGLWRPAAHNITGCWSRPATGSTQPFCHFICSSP